MWAFFAVFLSLTSAVYVLCMQNVRLSPTFFMIYRGVISALLIIPFLLYFRFVPSLTFCSIAFIQGLIVSYYDLGIVQNVKKYGAETTSSILPVGIVLNFLFWCLIDHQTVIEYLAHPTQTLFIILSLIGVTSALMGYKKVSIVKNAIISLIPIMAMGLLIDLSNKIIMNYANVSLVGCSFWRAFILSVTVGIVHLAFYLSKKEDIRKLFQFENLKKTWIFTLNIIAMVVMSLAMYYTPNPAYISAIAQTSLLWIMFLSQAFPILFQKSKQGTKINRAWAFLMLGSVILLIMFAN